MYEQVVQIYAEGLETDNATFETKTPNWEAMKKVFGDFLDQDLQIDSSCC